MRLRRPHPPRASLHTRRRRCLALVASSPTPSLRVHPQAGQRRRLALPPHTTATTVPSSRPLLPFVPSRHQSSCTVAHPQRHRTSTLPPCCCSLSPLCRFAHWRTPSPARSHLFALTCLLSPARPLCPHFHAHNYVRLVICRC